MPGIKRGGNASRISENVQPDPARTHRPSLPDQGKIAAGRRTMDASRNAAAEWRSFWPLPLAAALGYSTSVLHVYSIGAYIGSLQLEFGWSRAQISAGITIASFG